MMLLILVLVYLFAKNSRHSIEKMSEFSTGCLGKQRL